jgi:hypothetical protein
MKRLLALPILFSLPLLAAAQPEQADYLYLDLGYGKSETDVPGGDVEGNGLGFEVSVPVREHIHLVGGYAASELDDNADADSVEKYFGVGTQWSLARKLSVYGQAGVIDLDLDVGAGNLEDDGLFLSGGVRFMPTAGWEIRGGFDYVDLDVLDTDTSLFVATDLFLTDVVALTARITGNDDTTALTIGGRFYFGNEQAR